MLLSRELAHLPLSHLKGVTLPVLCVVSEPQATYGGFYVHPMERSYELPSGHKVPARHGALRYERLHCPTPLNEEWLDVVLRR